MKRIRAPFPAIRSKSSPARTSRSVGFPLLSGVLVRTRRGTVNYKIENTTSAIACKVWLKKIWKKSLRHKPARPLPSKTHLFRFLFFWLFFLTLFGIQVAQARRPALLLNKCST